MHNPEYDVNIDSDIYCTLKKLRLKVDEWIKEYGENSHVRTYAGYNNVDIIINTDVKDFNFKGVDPE